MSSRGDQNRRVAVVTGATSGIGRWTVLGLAQAGFDVLAVGRDRARADDLENWLKAQLPAAQIKLILADLSLMSGVRRLAGEIRDRETGLDLLINNAGLCCRQRQRTPEGHELTFAVNYLAPFLLTQELLPTLSTVQGSRIVNVGSAASDRATLDPLDLGTAEGWTGLRAYGRSKLALMSATFELGRRLGDADPTVNIVHPGGVATRIGEVGGALGLAWTILKPLLLSPEAGAKTTLDVAIDPALARVTGRYFKRSKIAMPNPSANDVALAQKLWATTESALAHSEDKAA